VDANDCLWSPEVSPHVDGTHACLICIGTMADTASNVQMLDIRPGSGNLLVDHTREYSGDHFRKTILPFRINASSSISFLASGKSSDSHNFSRWQICPVGITTQGTSQCGLHSWSQRGTCVRCPRGRFSFLTGAISADKCLPCAKGSSSIAYQLGCQLCPPGTKSRF